jgi:hypothetical protein
VWSKFKDVSEVLAASIIKKTAIFILAAVRT